MDDRAGPIKSDVFGGGRRYGAISITSAVAVVAILVGAIFRWEKESGEIVLNAIGMSVSGFVALAVGRSVCGIAVIAAVCHDPSANVFVVFIVSLSVGIHQMTLK